jgi:hypothetical protein
MSDIEEAGAIEWLLSEACDRATSEVMTPLDVVDQQEIPLITRSGRGQLVACSTETTDEAWRADRTFVVR